jgi:hypothetical protein
MVQSRFCPKSPLLFSLVPDGISCLIHLVFVEDLDLMKV